MKQNIVKDLTNDEVREKLADERAAYTKLKLSHQVSPLENSMRIRQSRRLIARLITELKKRSTANQKTTK